MIQENYHEANRPRSFRQQAGELKSRMHRVLVFRAARQLQNDSSPQKIAKDAKDQASRHVLFLQTFATLCGNQIATPIDPEGGKRARGRTAKCTETQVSCRDGIDPL